MSKSVLKSVSESVAKGVVPAAPSDQAPPLTTKTLTGLLEALGGASLPPLPREIAQVVDDYWQAVPTLVGLREGQVQLRRCSPLIAAMLQELHDGGDLADVWRAHPGVMVAGALIAVWIAAVRNPHLPAASTAAEEWLALLLPISRYLEPVLRGSPRPNWQKAVEPLQDAAWVAGWLGDAELARRIADYAAKQGRIGDLSAYHRQRRRGVEELLVGIQIVLGQGPLPVSALGQLLPAVEPAPAVPVVRPAGAVVLSPLAVAPAGAVPGLPHNYVVRRELASLGACLTAAGASGRAIVLTGIAGVGKSTLAAALAGDPGVQAAFPDGILWVEVERDSPSELVRRLCHQVGITGWPHAPWLRYWRQWAAGPGRRALVILDDLVDPAVLGAIAGPLGAQMALLVTTQFGTPVAEELANWLPAGAIQCLKVAGLAPAEAGQLCERILGRPLTAGELPWWAEVGELLDWHAGGLVFAAHQVQEYGWEGVLAELRAGRLADEQLRRSSLVVG